MRGEVEGLAEIPIKVAVLEIRMGDLKRGEIGGLPEIQMRVDVLEERLNEWKRTGDEAGRKLWSVVPALVGAVIGGVLTLIVQLLIHYLRPS